MASLFSRFAADRRGASDGAGNIDVLGINASYARSKNWDEFAGADAPMMDVIATVCDSAAGETCPVWPGHPTTYHWPFPDPTKYLGSEEDTRTHFREVFAMIKKRIDNFLACEG